MLKYLVLKDQFSPKVLSVSPDGRTVSVFDRGTRQQRQPDGRRSVLHGRFFPIMHFFSKFISYNCRFCFFHNKEFFLALVKRD